MPNLRPVGCFIQWYKQVQALLHALSRGPSTGWICKQTNGDPLLTPKARSSHSRETTDFENPVVHSNWNHNSKDLAEQHMKSFIILDSLEQWQQFPLNSNDIKTKYCKQIHFSCEHAEKHSMCSLSGFINCSEKKTFLMQLIVYY